MNILVTGGCGYVGSLLIKNLVKKHKVINIDTQWFGNYLGRLKNLKNIKCDIRDIPDKYFKNIDVCVHLANIANDPAVELMPSLSWDVNVLASYKIVNQCINNKVKKIIYASSGSVYGVKKEKKVHEDLPLTPISIYNKTKMVAERVFLSYSDKIIVNCVRPGTVCGKSPRMRLDLSVNMLTHSAFKNKKITVFGGDQIRPNIHINDMIDVYRFFIEKNIKSGSYNASFENLKINDIAKKIQKFTQAKILYTSSNDPRSYRQDSSRLLRLGFKSKYTVEDAISELLNFYKKFKPRKNNYSVKWLKKIKIK